MFVALWLNLFLTVLPGCKSLIGRVEHARRYNLRQHLPFLPGRRCRHRRRLLSPQVLRSSVLLSMIRWGGGVLKSISWRPRSDHPLFRLMVLIFLGWRLLPCDRMADPAPLLVVRTSGVWHVLGDVFPTAPSIPPGTMLPPTAPITPCSSLPIFLPEFVERIESDGMVYSATSCPCYVPM